MITATLILILSVAMFIYYFQVICQTILRREFDREYFWCIVNANRLEFLTMRQAIKSPGKQPSFEWFRQGLRCDFLALTYLLKHSPGARQGYSREARVLTVYFRIVYLFMLACHVFRLGEQRALVQLTSILEHLANLAGQRVSDSLDAPVIG